MMKEDGINLRVSHDSEKPSNGPALWPLPGRAVRGHRGLGKGTDGGRMELERPGRLYQKRIGLEVNIVN